MDKRDKLYAGIAADKARQYAEIKRGYKTPEEKRAFRLAERVRREQWQAGLEALPADERRAREKAFSCFKRQVVIATLLPKKRPGKLRFKPVKPEDGHIFS